MMRDSIVVVGSLNMDLVVRTPRHPRLGETVIGSSFATYPGGKGANQAVAAARLGLRVRMIGRVGADAFGEELARTVAQDGVDTTFISRDPEAATGVALITVDSAGQNSIVVASGANARLGPADVAAAEGAWTGAAALVMQLESPIPALERAIELARKRGVQAILNPAPAQTMDPALLARVDFLIPNQSELALLTGLEDVAEGIRRLQSWGVKRVIVTLGGDGALLADGEKWTRFPAHHVQAVDTTAAGDAFVGAFATALTRGHSTEEAVRWGNAAGALAVTRAGAQPSLPGRSELEQFLAQAE
jgi:ribokinase